MGMHRCRAHLPVDAGRPTDSVEFLANRLASACFKIRAAETSRERRSASDLLSRMYATRGYQSTPFGDEESADAKTFLASDHNAAIGTLTIGLDSSVGLKVDELFPDEVDRFRDAGLRICEFTKLAMDRRARSPRLVGIDVSCGVHLCASCQAVAHLLIEVNPRHVRYYETMLGFDVIAAARHNPRVNAPAVLLSL